MNRQRKADKKSSLYPLKFDEALKAILSIQLEKK